MPRVAGKRPASEADAADLFRRGGPKAIRVASVGDEDAQYRMLRAGSVGYMFYLGAFSKDVLVNLAIDYENPGHAFMWFLNLAIFYYTSNAWAKAPYTLKKST